MSDFYDHLAPFYHLIYPDWNASVDRQASILDVVIRERLPNPLTLLDVACGIGTQAIGLASTGYDVSASDLSPVSVDRARVEAQRRNLSIPFDVADMCHAFDHWQRTFDVVIALDNAVAHLLTEEALRAAFGQMHAATNPGGLCLISCRDYAEEPSTGTHLKPYGMRVEDGVRYILWQVWEFVDGTSTYENAFYFAADDGIEVKTHVMRSTFHAVRLERLAELMSEAGFVDVERIDDRFFQPLLVAMRPMYTLAELLDGVTEENLHPETDWGRPVGNEIIDDDYSA
jgi:2-polyprenyl-3-methyl-5-hydroxy-6-metoxy-1,4-benzoquinol methylase/antitoxin component of MazEF toxin-antitoxin module